MQETTSGTQTASNNIKTGARTVALVCGLAFLWLCLKAAALELTSLFGEAASFRALAWYGCYTVAVLILCYGMSRLHSRPVRDKRVLSVICALCGSVGLWLIASGLNGWPVILASLLLLAMFVACYTGLWGSIVAGLPLARIPLVIASSYALSEGVRALGTSLGFIDVARFIFPVLSLVCLLFQQLPTGTAAVSESRSLKGISWKTVGTGTLLVILWTIAQGVIANTSGTLLSREHLVWSYTLSFVVLTGMAVYFLIQSRRGASTGAKGFARRTFLYPFALITVGYMAVLAVVMMLPASDPSVVKRTLISVDQCLEVFILILIMHDVAERRLSHYLVLGLYATLFTSGPWMTVSDAIKASNILSAVPLGANAPIILSFVTAIVFIVFLLTYAVSSDAAVDVTDVADASSASATLCERAARGAGLSDRELEVMRLLYRGYSGRQIGQTLFISDSTVRSHTNSIYKKLAIHSKQELMALVDAYRK